MRPTLIAFALVAVLAACGGKSEAEKEREVAAKSGRGTVTCDGSAMSGETGPPADFPSIDGIMFVTSAQNGPTRAVDEKCVAGIEANRENAERYAELTLSAATALNPHIGYDKASEIVKTAAATGKSLREVAREAGVDEKVLDEALDYRAMAKPQN